MTSEERTPEIIVEQSPTFKRIIITGIFGTISPLGSEATVYSEQNLHDDALKKPDIDLTKMKVKRIVECDLIINPLQMIAIRDWLNKKIDDYEKFFGKISNINEIEDRMESLRPKESTNSTTS